MQIKLTKNEVERLARIYLKDRVTEHFADRVEATDEELLIMAERQLNRNFDEQDNTISVEMSEKPKSAAMEALLRGKKNQPHKVIETTL